MRNSFGMFIKGHTFNLGRRWTVEKKKKMIAAGFTRKGRKLSIKQKERRMTGKVIKCRVCTNSFYVKKSHLRKRRDCSRKCMGISRKGFIPWNKGMKLPDYSADKAFNWKGGKTMEKYGYVYIYAPNHPHSIHGRYVLEHRLVIEKSLGRILEKNEIVHHRNKIRHDNRLSNLQLMTQAEHMRHHTEERKRTKPYTLHQLK